MAAIKGVEDNFEQLTSIDSLLYGTGKFILNDSVVDYGFMGVELVSELGTGLRFLAAGCMHLKGMYVSTSPIRRRLWTRIICSRRERCLLSTSRNTTSRYILASVGLCRFVRFWRGSFRHRTETETGQPTPMPCRRKWNAPWATASSCKTATSSKRMYSVSWRLRNSSPTCSLPLYLQLPASMLSVRCPC